jgi:Mor family transcriptional regulator
MRRHPSMPWIAGRFPRPALSQRQIRSLHLAHESGVTMRDLAKRFRLSTQAIRALLGIPGADLTRGQP